MKRGLLTLLFKIKASNLFSWQKIWSFHSFLLIWNSFSLRICSANYLSFSTQHWSWKPGSALLSWGRNLEFWKYTTPLQPESLSYLGKTESAGGCGRDGGRRPPEGSWLSLETSKHLSEQGGISVITRRFWFNKMKSRCRWAGSMEAFFGWILCIPQVSGSGYSILNRS